MNAIRQILFRKVVRPMRTTFATSLGRKSAVTSVIVKVVLADGSQGAGEVPTSFVLPHETPAAIEAILREARSLLAGTPIDDYAEALATLRRRHSPFHMTRAGLEVALFRAGLASRGEGEWAHWGARLRQIETDITVPFVPEGDEMERWLDWAIGRAFRVYKVKVSGRVGDDLPFVQRVHRRLSAGPPGFTIRLDGNQGYTPRSCLHMLDALERRRLAVELIEQPLRRDDYAGLRQLAGRANVPIILDETVFSADDCRRVIEDRLGDGVNIKIAKSGIAESAAILRLARRAGLKLMIGCMTETMVGLSAGICLAAGTGAFDYVDLDSIHFLHHRGAGGAAATGGAEGIQVVGPRYVLGGVP